MRSVFFEKKKKKNLKKEKGGGKEGVLSASKDAEKDRSRRNDGLDEEASFVGEWATAG